jgi:DNA-directed RNA polymerase specialized sigma24 family protein
VTGDIDLSRLERASVAFRLADFGKFYERTYDVAYRTALGVVRDPALAADVTQDAYVAAYRHRDDFRGDAPSAAWLHRIVVNEALAARRRWTALRPESAPIHARTGRDESR